MRENGMNDVQIANWLNENGHPTPRGNKFKNSHVHSIAKKRKRRLEILDRKPTCLLYTSPSPRDRTRSRMPSSA